MVQSFAKLQAHLVFSTKARRPVLADWIRDPLHAYMATVLQNLGCVVVLINSVEDHVHLLFDLGRTASTSQAVQDVKSASSKWLKTQGAAFTTFAWQTGYGAYAVSESNVDAVRQYIAGQREHHRKISFQEEYRELMRRNGIKFDEQFGWD
ncbi:MAG TPA: IS200/IS605 family transposase [Pirellulales bacterium]|jgi:REP element-mobilizing transposase RayT